MIPARTPQAVSEGVEVDAHLPGIGVKTLLLDGAQRPGGDPHAHVTPSLRPPEAPLLQVHLLQLFGADVGVADGHGIVGALATELADPRHGISTEAHSIAHKGAPSDGEGTPAAAGLGGVGVGEVEAAADEGRTEIQLEPIDVEQALGIGHHLKARTVRQGVGVHLVVLPHVLGLDEVHGVAHAATAPRADPHPKDEIGPLLLA